MKKDSKKGFTLIELLAVIIILGVLMLIAIPSVTEYISNSRKKAYIAIADQYISGTTTKVNGLEYSFTDQNIAYYVPISCINIEKGGKSPYGNWEYAYVVVTFDGNNYNYYWTSKDDSGHGVSLANINELNTSIVKANFEETTPIAGENIAINGKSYIIGISDNNTCGNMDTNGLTTLYRESLLNGAYPVLGTDLIPIIIENDGTVKKANTETEWYSYASKRWANAVVLINKTITYASGDIIPESNIESYFVWIPRYRYKLWNVNNTTLTTVDPSAVHSIEIKFEGKAVSPSTGSTNGSFLTHPAFTSFNSNGMWVGKFETGYNGAASTVAAQVNSSDSNKIIIKPDVYSWRSVQVANAFTASFNYQRSLDSHMMKNTEWGAVAYLSHSIYGNASSLRINNNSSYRTGYSAVAEPTKDYPEYLDYGTSTELTQPYNTTIGYLASTTGNITGIYDMSGGAYEYVMGVQVDATGTPLSGTNNLYNSGFNGTFGCPSCSSGDPAITTLTTGITLPQAKYYDAYEVNSNGNRGKRIVGDATGELGPFGTITTYGTESQCGVNLLCSIKVSSWYGDNANFVSSSYPWFKRGGYYNTGSGSGAFYFVNGDGNAYGNYAFRLVLTP